MKYRKFNYRNKIPKSLKKTNTHFARSTISKKKSRKSSQWTLKNKLKIPNLIQKPAGHFMRVGLVKIIPKFFIFPFLIMIIIIIIPTLIVVPFEKDEEESAAVFKDNQTTEIDQNISPFSVAVERSSSEKIEDVPLEKYVIGVVASEMPATFEKEALKAQGLAARTYIVNHLLYQDSEKKSDVTDTEIHQVYKSEEELHELWGPSEFEDKMENLKEAVESTKGEILTYDGKPITPAFFSTSNGYTENSEEYWEDELPYLRSVVSDWDKNSPEYLDQKIYTIAQVEKLLDIDLSHDDSLEIELSRTDSNRVKELNIENNLYSGRDIRERFDLKSSDFSIKQNKDHLVFTTKGYGHGIGMSQYGANGMAQEGKGYKDIVEYYYKNVEVSNINEVAPALVTKSNY